LAKAKAKAAVKRSPAKAPTRAAAAPKSAASKSVASKSAASKSTALKSTALKSAASKSVAAKSAKATVAKTSAAKPVKSVVTKPVAKPATTTAAKVAVKPATTPDIAPPPRVTQQLSLPAAKQAEAPVAKPQPIVRKPVEATGGRADLPPADGFTLLVDGHFKNNYDDLKGAKAAASELKGRFPMLRVEIYDAAKKARLPA
jgi:hypothetical protein